MLVAVWLTPAGSGLRGRLEPSTWRAIREPRPVPRELARLPEVRITGAALLGIVVLLLALVPVVFFRYSRSVWLGIDHFVTTTDEALERRSRRSK